MAQSTGSSIQISELEIHKKAYLQLFQAVLQKVPGEPDKKRSTLASLRDYLNNNVNSTDEFIDHLAEFATTIGVPAPALGKFIGSNFMQALARVRKEGLESQEGGSSPGASPAAKKKFSSFLEELVGTLDLDSPGRFLPHEYGLMKLETPSGLQLPLSGGGTPVQSSQPTVDAPGTPTEPEGGVPVTGEKPAARAPKPASSSFHTDSDPLLLEEILTEFGEFFQGMPSRLVVSPFPRKGGGAPAPVTEESDPVEDPEAPSQSPGGTPAASRSPAAPGSAHSFDSDEGESILLQIIEEFGENLETFTTPIAPDPFFEPGGRGLVERSAPPPEGTPASDTPAPTPSHVERGDDGGSILMEILESFGDQVTDGKRLVVSSGLEDGEYDGADEEAHDGDPMDDSEEEGSPGFTPIPLNYEQFLTLSRAIQEFQKNNDRDGYKAWMQAKGGIRARLYVGLKNLEGRERKSESIYWYGEYEKLAGSTGSDAQAIQELHNRIRGYAQLQLLLQKFTASVSSAGDPLLSAFKPIWPQIRQIFNEPGEESSYLARLKIILLQVSDPSLQSQIKERMEPVFRRATEILNN